jgi:hypothetical protein
MLTEYGLRTLKGLNTIRDWKRNRSWVNRGVKVLGAFSQAQIEDLKETYPNLSSTISRLWNKVEEGRKRAAKKQALNNFSGSELFNDIYLPIIDEIAPTLETWADHFIKWKKTDVFSSADLFEYYSDANRSTPKERRELYASRRYQTLKNAYYMSRNEKSLNDFLDSEREKFIKNEQDKVATLILRTIDKVGGGVLRKLK